MPIEFDYGKGVSYPPPPPQQLPPPFLNTEYIGGDGGGPSFEIMGYRRRPHENPLLFSTAALALKALKVKAKKKKALKVLKFPAAGLALIGGLTALITSGVIPKVGNGGGIGDVRPQRLIAAVKKRKRRDIENSNFHFRSDIDGRESKDVGFWDSSSDFLRPDKKNASRIRSEREVEDKMRFQRRISYRIRTLVRKRQKSDIHILKR